MCTHMYIHAHTLPVDEKRQFSSILDHTIVPFHVLQPVTRSTYLYLLCTHTHTPLWTT